MKYLIAGGIVLACTVGATSAHASLIPPIAAEGYVQRDVTVTMGPQGPVSSEDFSMGMELGASHVSAPSALGPPESSEQRSVIEYDLSQFDDTTGLFATLVFDIEDFEARADDAFGFTVYWYEGDGALTTSDYDVTANHVEVFDISTTEANMPGQFIMDVTAPFQQAVSDEVTYIGFLGVIEDSGLASDPTSIDFSSATMTVIPEPASAALLTLGALYLLFRRRPVSAS